MEAAQGAVVSHSAWPGRLHRSSHHALLVNPLPYTVCSLQLQQLSWGHGCTIPLLETDFSRDPEVLLSTVHVSWPPSLSLNMYYGLDFRTGISGPRNHFLHICPTMKGINERSHKSAVPHHSPPLTTSVQGHVNLMPRLVGCDQHKDLIDVKVPSAGTHRLLQLVTEVH